MYIYQYMCIFPFGKIRYLSYSNPKAFVHFSPILHTYLALFFSIEVSSLNIFCYLKLFHKYYITFRMSAFSGPNRVAVTITGAAGRIAYSLIPLICSGQVFGPNTKIDLRLLDIPLSATKLEGLKLEIEDACYDLLDRLVLTVSAEEAFTGTEVAVLLGKLVL